MNANTYSLVKIEPAIEEVILRLERMQSAMRIAEEIAREFNWDPEIKYATYNTLNNTKTLICFNLKGCPEIAKLMDEAKQLAGGGSNECNRGYSMLQICPDDGDLRTSVLKVTKDKAVQLFISQKLGINPSDLFEDGKWTDWTGKPEEEVIGSVKEQLAQLRDILTISNRLAKKVRKEIDLQFESFTGWKAAKQPNQG